MGCLIFDGKFRIHLNEKLLLVSLSDKSEGSDLTLNMESHDNMLERLQSVARKFEMAELSFLVVAYVIPYWFYFPWPFMQILLSLPGSV